MRIKLDDDFCPHCREWISCPFNQVDLHWGHDKSVLCVACPDCGEFIPLTVDQGDED